MQHNGSNMKYILNIYQSSPCLNRCLSRSNYENQNYNEEPPQVNISGNVNSLTDSSGKL